MNRNIISWEPWELSDKVEWSRSVWKLLISKSDQNSLRHAFHRIIGVVLCCRKMVGSGWDIQESGPAKVNRMRPRKRTRNTGLDLDLDLDLDHLTGLRVTPS